MVAALRSFDIRLCLKSKLTNRGKSVSFQFDNGARFYSVIVASFGNNTLCHFLMRNLRILVAHRRRRRRQTVVL